MLVDSHCHLNFADFAETGMETIINNANANGVNYFLSIATEMKELPDVVASIEKYPNIFGAFALHPEYIGQQPLPSLDMLCQILAHPKMIGVGETGFDFSFAEAAPLKQQEEAFYLHIEAAKKMDLPVIIHSRDADEASIKVLKEASKSDKLRGLIHCFSSGFDLALTALEAGFYISASGIVTFGKSADSVRDAFKQIPLNRILVETDAPFLAPVPMRGKRNEPSFVKYTAQKIAEIKEISFEEVEEQTTANFFNLFTKAKR